MASTWPPRTSLPFLPTKLWWVKSYTDSITWNSRGFSYVILFFPFLIVPGSRQINIPTPLGHWRTIHSKIAETHKSHGIPAVYLGVRWEICLRTQYISARNYGWLARWGKVNNFHRVSNHIKTVKPHLISTERNDNGLIPDVPCNPASDGDGLLKRISKAQNHQRKHWWGPIFT